MPHWVRTSKCSSKKSNTIVSVSGWHLTENLAPKLVALIEENGTPSQKRVFKPESGLDLGQAQDLIKEVLEKKHGKVSDSPFIPGFPPASEKPPQGKGWTLSRVRLPVEVIRPPIAETLPFSRSPRVCWNPPPASNSPNLPTCRRPGPGFPSPVGFQIRPGATTCRRELLCAGVRGRSTRTRWFGSSD